MVADLKEKDPNKWYSAVKRMTSYDNKSEELTVDEMSHLTDQEQCDIIADEFTHIPNQFSPLHKEDIVIPPFKNSDIPQFKASQVWKKLAAMKTNKSSQKDDIPANILK